MLRIPGAVLVVGLVVVAAAPASAQPRTMHDLRDEPGTWKPWHMTLSSGSRQSVKATPAELKAFEAELVKLREILRAAPAVAEPRGFGVEVWGYLAAFDPSIQSEAKAWPIPGGVDFGAFPIFEYERNGKVIRTDTGETALLLFSINDISRSVIGRPGPPEWSALDLDVFTQPPATGQRAGWPLHDDIIVITKRTGPLWTPVALGEALSIDRKAAQLQRDEAAAVVGRFKKDLDDLLDPVKKAARQAEYERTATQMPNAKAYLDQMAEVDRIRETSLRAELDPSKGSARRLGELDWVLARIEQRIARIPEADTAAPACYDSFGTSPEARIRRGPAPKCAPLVRSNRDFFDRALPRSAPQLVVVPQARRCYEDANRTGPEHPSGCTANRQLLESLDRQKILDWLK